MRSSLRTWLFTVSVLFAVLVVGGISVTTYAIVANGMADVAAERAVALSKGAAAIADQLATVARAENKADDQGYLLDLPATARSSGLIDGEFALYAADGRLLWQSGPMQGTGELRDERLQALQSGRPVQSVVRERSLIAGLIMPVDLGVFVVHVPVSLPSGNQGVLDVLISPVEEEHVIDSIRLPMGVLAVSATVIMVVLMQTSMVWVLKLVDDLRKAADDIDAGRLDERLPVTGQNEIADLAASLNRLIDRLQRASKLQTRFVADASHELATPVAGIRGYVSILRNWGADDPQVRAEAIDAIDRESQRMTRLTQDLLTLLHTEEGLVYESVRFDVNALVRERIAVTASKWIDKNLEFEGPERDEELVMQGDPNRVEDVLSILLDNAAKYTPEGGRVSVDTRRRKDWIIIEVSDTGQGIPPEDLPHVFERYYRSEVSRTSSEGGFGLGLAIAKGIVQGAGGSLDVESEVGVGTRFTIRMPRGRP